MLWAHSQLLHEMALSKRQQSYQHLTISTSINVVFVLDFMRMMSGLAVNSYNAAAHVGSMRTVYEMLCTENEEERICPVCLSEI